MAASFQAPVLFTLAEDLSEMELQVDVDEADVGSVRDGQAATFTVDAYPGRKYPARITRVGYGSQTKDNVVSYKTLLTRGQRRPDAAARDDGERGDHDRAAHRRAARAERRAAVLRRAAAGQPEDQSGSLVSSLLPRPPGPPAEDASRPTGSRTRRRRCGCCATDSPWPCP